MPDPINLSEQNRTKLDGIVQQMIKNKESEDNIQFVVEDFKSKYGLKKKDTTAIAPNTKSASVPKTGSSVGKGTQVFPEIDMNSVAPGMGVQPDYAAMIEKDKKKSQKIKALETSFYEATKHNDDDAVAEQRTQEAIKKEGFWNTVKDWSKKAVNATSDFIFNMTDEGSTPEALKIDTDPLAEEKKRVKTEALKNKEKLTDEQVNTKAAELYKQKQKDNLFVDRANSFLDNLDEKDKELLRQDRAEKASHLQEDNAKKLKVVAAMQTVGNEKIKEYQKLEKQIKANKEKGIATSDELYQQYTSLGSQIKNIGTNINKYQNEILKNKSDLGTAQEELDLFQREYGDVDNFIGNVIASTGELLNNAVLKGGAYFASGNPSMPGSLALSYKLHELSKKGDEKLDEYRNVLRKPVEEVKSVEGFVNYASDLVANQIPNLVATSTGAGGLALIGTASTGQKYAEMKNDVIQGKENYSAAQMAFAPLLYGGAEVISEIPTLSILKKGGRVLESVAKNEAELVAKTAKQKAIEWSKDFGVDMSKEMAGEQFTNFAQNFNDKYVLGKKDVGLLDNTGRVFKDTFTLTSILKTAPHVFGAVAKIFQSKNELGTLDENSRKIIEFSRQLNTEGLTDTEKAVIQKQIDKATTESATIMKNTIGKITDMPDRLYDEVVKLNKEAGELKTQAKEIADGNLPNKEDLLKGLAEDYKALQDERNAIVEGRTTEVDVLPLKEQEKLKKQAMEDLVTELNPDGKKNITISNEQVLERANQIYADSVKNESNKTQTSTPSSQEEATPSVNSQISVADESRDSEVFPNPNEIKTEVNNFEDRVYSQQEIENYEGKFDKEYNDIIDKIDAELEKKGITSFEQKTKEYHKNKDIQNNIKKAGLLRDHNNNIIKLKLDKAIKNINFPNYFNSKNRQSQIEEDIKKGITKRFLLDSDLSFVDLSTKLKGLLEGNELKGLQEEIVTHFLEPGTTFKELSSDQKTEALKATKQIFDSVVENISNEFIKNETVSPTNPVADGIATTGIEPNGAPRENDNIPEAVNTGTSETKAEIKPISVGKFDYRYDQGEWKATDKEGNPVSNKDIPKKVQELHADSFDFTQGETALDKQKINDVSTWEEDVAAHSDNPVEVAETLLNAQSMDATEGLDTVSKHIAEVIGGKGVERSSYAQRAGKKGMKDIPGALALQYFAKKGQGQSLDIIAQNAEIAMYGDWDSTNPRITEDDVLDFINDNPGGAQSFLNGAKKAKVDALKTAFTHLTGLPANEKFLTKAIEQQRAKDTFINDYMTEIDALTDEELLSLQDERQQFEIQENGTAEKTSETKPSGKRESKTADSEESKERSRIQSESGPDVSGKEKPEQTGRIDEFANEQNRKNDLAKERVQYEKITPKNAPKKLAQIVKSVSDGLKSHLIYSRPKKSNTLGSYNPRNTLMRITRAGDVDTVAHELGHLLDDRHDILGTIPEASELAIVKQLKWYSDRGGSNPPSGITAEQKAEYLEREGLAEFIRSYVANPSQTKIIAPELLAHFENTIDPKTKEVLQQFSNDYLDLANASGIEKTLSNVEDIDLPNKQKFIEWIKSFRKSDDKLSFTKMDKFYAEMANSNHFGIKAFKTLLDIQGKTDLKSHENFEIMSRLFSGINGKLENVFVSGMINAKNERLKAEGGVFSKNDKGRTVYKDGTAMNVEWLINGLDTTTESSLKKDMNDVIAMAVAERTIEYAKKFERTDNLSGIGAGIESDLAVAVNAMNEFKELKKTDKAKYDRIKDAVKRYRQMADATLQYAADKGRISAEQYEQIKNGNEFYVALNRNKELEPGEDLFSSFNTGTNGIGAAKEVIKKAKGGTATIENPYLSLLRNMNNIIKEADRNEVMLSFVEPLISNRKMGEGEPLDLSKIGFIANNGDAETIKVFRDGQLEKWKFDAEIYKSLKNIESIASNPIMDLLSKPSQLIRWTVTHNPVFYARNVVKDTQARLIVSNDHSTLKDMLHNTGDKELFELFGGSQAGHLHTSKESYAKTMKSTIKEITKKGGIVLDPMKLGEKYVRFLQTGENLNRIAEFNAAYKTAKKQGMSDYDAGLYAAFEARDLMDFAVAGHTMRDINKIIVFSNAGVQSLRKANKAIRRDPAGFAYRTALYSVLPAVAFAALRNVMGDEDDEKEYENLPDNQRDMFYNFKTPATGDAWISIAKPYELGLASAFVDRAISKIKGNDEAFDGILGTTMKTLMPFDESSFLGGLKPIIEAQMNRNTFTDRSIVPEWESGKLLELRKGVDKASLISQKTSNLLKQAGISVDPRNIDHILRGYGTYFANQGMAISDLAKKDRAELNFWITKSGFAKDVPTFNAKSVKRASDLAVELGKINSKPMKSLRNAIEEFSLETDLKKRKELLKEIYQKSEEIGDKYEKEKQQTLEKAKTPD